MILTDDDIKAIYDNEKGGDYYDTVWAIEAAILAKLSSVEPVYQWRRIAGDGRWRDSTKEEAYASVDDFYEARTLFTHPPAPSAAEGYQLVPIEPTTHMVNEGLCGCMDNDVTVCIYKKMLAAAKEMK